MLPGRIAWPSVAWSAGMRPFRLLAGATEPMPARDFAERILSLQKAVFLDIGLTLEAYFTQSTQKLRQALDPIRMTEPQI